MRSVAAIAVVVLIFAASSANAQNVMTLTVGPGQQYAHLADAVAVANGDPSPNDYYVINLAPGTYVNDFAEIDRPMTIQADPAQAPKRAILKATIPLPNQKGILLTFSSLTVHSLVLTGAMISDDLGGNGAGIRDQNPEGSPASLTIVNSILQNNQEGILQGDDAQETVTIISSQIKNNGNPNPDVFQHGIYIDEAASLTVANSVFCGQLIGHLLKSRAAQTVVTGSRFYGGEGAPAALGCRVGNSSYDVQAANGGILVVSGNTLVQGPSVQNNNIIDYGGEGSYPVNRLVLTRNTFISTAGSIGILDLNCVPAELDGNTYQGLSQVLSPPQCIAAGDSGQ